MRLGAAVVTRCSARGPVGVPPRPHPPPVEKDTPYTVAKEADTKNKLGLNLLPETSQLRFLGPTTHVAIDL